MRARCTPQLRIRTHPPRLDHVLLAQTVRMQIAHFIGITPRCVQIWFQNRRQKWKSMQSNMGIDAPPPPRQTTTRLQSLAQLYPQVSQMSFHEPPSYAMPGHHPAAFQAPYGGAPMMSAGGVMWAPAPHPAAPQMYYTMPPGNMMPGMMPQQAAPPNPMAAPPPTSGAPAAMHQQMVAMHAPPSMMMPMMPMYAPQPMPHMQLTQPPAAPQPPPGPPAGAAPQPTPALQQDHAASALAAMAAEAPSPMTRPPLAPPTAFQMPSSAVAPGTAFTPAPPINGTMPASLPAPQQESAGGVNTAAAASYTAPAPAPGALAPAPRSPPEIASDAMEPSKDGKELLGHFQAVVPAAAADGPSTDDAAPPSPDP